MTADHDMRLGKLMAVYNEHNKKMGVLDDIILPAAAGWRSYRGSLPDAVLSVGEKLIRVPWTHLR
jgi:hypothetical protein